MHDLHPYVLAALDGPPAAPAVCHVAGVMGEVLGLPVRPVHVMPGPGLRGEARRGALRRVERGDAIEIPGRPEDVLAHLVDAAPTALAVLGTSRRTGRPGGRRLSGTAVAVARRAERPLLLVPPSATGWGGPHRVLTPLDGTGITAMAAASALAAIRGPDTVGIPFHLGGDDNTARRFWQGPVDEHDAWVRESRTRNSPAAGTRLEARPGPVGQQVLQELTQSECDLVVLVWSRQTRGAHGAAVLEVLTASPVPVLLVPVTGGA